MRVLLVEPDYRRISPATSKNFSKPNRADETLWYPPLGLMKLSRFHKDRGDEVGFAYGCDPAVIPRQTLFDSLSLWDRVYVTTLFTFHFEKIVRTIKFYIDAVGGTVGKIFVGGVMASLMADELYRATNVRPIRGVLHSPSVIGLDGDEDIDLLPPDYDLLDPGLYGINDTYYAYTTRGCVNKCAWCGVHRLEPEFVPYIDIKPSILSLRSKYGDKAHLCLMDNNVLASPHFDQIVDDLLELGYGRGAFTHTQPKKRRVIDFNQGLDATHVTKACMKRLALLNVQPMRIAFDRVQERRQYVRAVQLARDNGVLEFSNYLLYDFKDTPLDLYERIRINIELNEQWAAGGRGGPTGKIYSYPMRYAPIDDPKGDSANRRREAEKVNRSHQRDWLSNPVWTSRFTRNIEIMKGAAHGAISTTSTLARRTIGSNSEEFMTNLYMPEVLLRNRNRHEKKVYEDEPRRRAGSGMVEAFRAFMMKLIRNPDERFRAFHDAVCQNSIVAIRALLGKTDDQEMTRWLRLYLKR